MNPWRSVGIDVQRLGLGGALGVDDRVERLVFDATAAAARLACSGSSAATIATASPK